MFADDLTEYIESVTTQINLLIKESAEKTGLKISFVESEYITDINNILERFDYSRINEVKKPKYHGVVTQLTGSEKEANQLRLWKLENLTGNL